MKTGSIISAYQKGLSRVQGNSHARFLGERWPVTVIRLSDSLLGSSDNTVALLDFLNAILQPAQAISEVDIINPYNEKEYMSDKLTIVDIKARDRAGCQYQIEIQLAIHADLPQRMLYTWADIYSEQLKQGNDYKTLKPVIAIWLLVNTLYKDSEHYHHRFQCLDKQHQRLLSEHCSIHVLELNKWRLGKTLKPEEHWLYFFKEAKNWDQLPALIDTPVMRQAMSTLKKYSDKEREYHLYQSRQNALRVQSSIQSEIEENQRALEQAAVKLGEAESKLVESENEKAAIAQETQQLLDLLEKHGIDPETKI